MHLMQDDNQRTHRAPEQASAVLAPVGHSSRIPQGDRFPGGVVPNLELRLGTTRDYVASVHR